MSEGGNLDIARPIQANPSVGDDDFQLVLHANENTALEKQSAVNYRLIGLLVSVAITTASWLLILIGASRLFGFGVSAGFMIGVGLLIAIISMMALALVMSNGPATS